MDQSLMSTSTIPPDLHSNDGKAGHHESLMGG